MEIENNVHHRQNKGCALTTAGAIRAPNSTRIDLYNSTKETNNDSFKFRYPRALTAEKSRRMLLKIKIELRGFSMFAFLIGMIGGGLELFLLRQLVKALESQRSSMMALILFIKLLVLVLAFTITVLFFRSDILWCGIGLVSVLVGGSFIQFIKTHRKEKGA